ncbi:YceI family protein [Wenyingzhuangia marina]|uniref:Polyisoprenoid-binding protein YceI n=1 Tax=Wenyingzhuangia marina TaxID=1195760 RepID=A0A1M5RZF7_9FLAO|nr:YceI family protein [Wenyingzhuangia marina]GGF78387.1 polyisoprenoid-binding protein [Wenyingzhuangia marina]SHH31757.1 Polyisoprenoid-binding protein YceI [Wenyingzhuangia marina]
MEKLTKWAIDPTHSEVAFKVKHMMISTVTGHFENFSANLETENEDFKGASFDFTAQIDSINTKNKDRDAHLKSDDFFNAESYPEMTFKSKSFDGETLIGDLTIRDITKEISLAVELNGVAVDPYGQTKAGFEIVGEINRKDFNLTWSAVTEAGSVVVSDKVKLVIDAQFIKQ